MTERKQGKGKKIQGDICAPPSQLSWEASQRDIQSSKRPPYNLSLAMLSQTPAPVSLALSWQQSRAEGLTAPSGSRTRFVWLLISVSFFRL